MEIARSGHLPLLVFLTTLRGEQFWGRAVRHASHDSNRVWGVCVFRPNIARAPRHAIPFRSRAPEHLVNKYLIINQKRVIPKAARTLQRGEGSTRNVRAASNSTPKPFPV